MNIFGSNNIYLWLLIILLVTNSGNSCNGGIFSGCSLPITIALLYCLTKNGTLPSLFGDCGNNSSGGCGCGCS